MLGLVFMFSTSLETMIKRWNVDINRGRKDTDDNIVIGTLLLQFGHRVTDDADCIGHLKNCSSFH